MKCINREKQVENSTRNVFAIPKCALTLQSRSSNSKFNFTLILFIGLKKIICSIKNGSTATQPTADVWYFLSFQGCKILSSNDNLIYIPPSFLSFWWNVYFLFLHCMYLIEFNILLFIPVISSKNVNEMGSFVIR